MQDGIGSRIARRLGFALALAVFSCRPETHAFRPVENETPQSCETRKTEFSSFVAELPERPIRLDVATELPISTLGVPPGAGSVLEVSPKALRFAGAPVERSALAERLANVPGTLYVASSGECIPVS